MPQALPTNKTDKHKQNRNKGDLNYPIQITIERTKENSDNRGSKESIHVVVRWHGMCLELLLHRLILFGSGGFVPACSKVLDAHGTEWC
jgi:hypothetical protein